MKSYVLNALKESVLECSKFIQSKPYLTQAEVSGDLYTRLNRHLKLTPIGQALSRNCIVRVQYNSEGIDYILLQKLRYSRPIEDELVQILLEIINQGDIDFKLLKIDAKLSSTIQQVENYKILENV